jgi:hypothetical protein
MPTIAQLPQTSLITSADEVPLSQSGITRATTLGALLAGTQPAIMAPSGTLLGRVSLGAGSPESITVGAGLTLTNASLTASAAPITSLPTVGTIAASDLVGISQGGADHSIAYSNFLNGQTIDLAQPALAASDSDSFWVAQGSSTMLRQSFSAMWNWIAAKLPVYKKPVVEISTNTTLDGTVHNGRILICSAPVTLTPAFINMGSGFTCEVVNLSSGAVTLGSGIVTSTGGSLLPAGQAARLMAATYSAGNVIFAAISGAAVLVAPGQVTGLAAGATTQTSIALTWSAPGGGAASSYTVQYRISGTTTWTSASASVTTTAFTVTGLTAATAYDFEVFAVDAAGAGTASAVLTASTSAPALVTSITWNLAPSGPYTHASGSIGVNVHVSPSTGTVQFGFSVSATVPPTSWTAGMFVNSDLWAAYVPTPATAGTYYAWAEGTDGSAPTVYPTPFVVS